MKQFLVIVLMTTTFTVVLAERKYVVIHGIARDSTIKFVKIAAPFLFPWSQTEQPIIREQNEQSNGAFDIKFELTSPTFLYFQVLMGSWEIYCSPGDSVSFVISKAPGAILPDIIFSGPNSGHYNYYNKAAQLKRRFAFPKFTGDATAYKNDVDAWHRHKEEQLTAYVKEFEVSPDFMEKIKGGIDFERVYLLYYPIRYKKISSRGLPPDYFTSISNLDFNQAGLVDVDFYRTAVVFKYIYCFDENLYIDFGTRYKNIISVFEGKSREYLLASLIGLYAKNQGESYRKELLDAFDNVSKLVKDPRYLEYIAQSENDYRLLNQPFPESLLTSTHLISYKDSRDITLAELLASNHGKAIYFDFWANWCAPCRDDIRNSADAKKLLKQENVVYLYFSVDKHEDISKWRAASEKDNIKDNQYLLVDGMKSEFAHFLKIDYIPRYLLIDKEHKVRKTVAPRPVAQQAEQLKASLSELKVAVHTYK